MVSLARQLCFIDRTAFYYNKLYLKSKVEVNMNATDQELDALRAWEKVAHCPECGHLKCSSCVGVDTDPGDWLVGWKSLPPELRRCAVYCCKCGKQSHLYHWIWCSANEHLSGHQPSPDQASIRERLAQLDEIADEANQGGK